MKTVFISGNFNILHPGHQRLIKFASELGDRLIVGVNSDFIAGDQAFISEEYRLEGVKNNVWVSEAFLLEAKIEEYLQTLKPDIVVKGKGEMAFYELIERIVEGESLEGLEGVYWKENGKVFSNPDRAQAPLDDDPPMPYHLVDIEKCLFASEFGKRTISYVSSYGCPYSCTFCVEVGVFNRRWVGLRADLVVNDLERLEKEYGVDAINFYDSLFFVSVKRAKGILQGVLDRKLTVRLGNLYGRSRQLNQSDDELWELLEKTRTYSILCGAESGDQDALDIMNKEMDVEDNIKFAKKCQDYGIKVIFSTLVGVPFPDHT